MLARVPAFLKRIVREPLVHFLAIGALLFGLNAVINGPDRDIAGGEIVISEGQVGQLVESYLLLTGRLPSREELQSLVDDFVTEDISYREAVAMGLDADDTIVRRRMRQKLDFLIEDGASSEEPTEVELQGWLADHAADYRLPERRAIRQVLFSHDRRGEAARGDAEAALERIKLGANPSGFGDRTMLPEAIPLGTRQAAAAVFGDVFAEVAFMDRAPGWFGPVTTPYGQHLVLVMEIEPGRDATLAEVRDGVRADIIETRRNATRDAFHARMRKRYDIRIDWPEPYHDLSPTPDPEPQTKRMPEVGE